jgi:glycosyltransferase involved in cell wall biosynthesis
MRDSLPVQRPRVLVTDAWHPQVNGVVNTWTYMQRELTAMGEPLTVVHAGGAPGIDVPGEPGLRLCLRPRCQILQALAGRTPASLHIATEGPLGWAARRLALARGWAFTTSYHTRFPDYLKARYGVPPSWTHAVLRRFHAPSRAVLVPTADLRDELTAAGFARVQVWARGVDGERFAPGARDALGLARPIHLCVGRVAPEKNLAAFLALDLPGTKVVIGDGPERARLQARHPQVHWLGAHDHAGLGRFYDAADVFVFPSRTDTFGLVMLEAMACGCPVAAYPEAGPRNVVTPGVSGVLHTELGEACRAALQLDRSAVRAQALKRSWRSIAEQLLGHFVAADLRSADTRTPDQRAPAGP